MVEPPLWFFIARVTTMAPDGAAGGIAMIYSTRWLTVLNIVLDGFTQDALFELLSP